MNAFVRLLLACTCACTVPAAQLDVTDLCVTYPDVKIPGVAAGTPTVDHQWTFDKLAAVQALVGSIKDLQLTSMDARSTDGTLNLGFITAAHVTVASGAPSSPLPVLDVYDCTSDCVPSDGTLPVPSQLQTSVLAYVETGSLLVDLDLAGTFPVEAWTIDVDACFRGTIDGPSI